MTLNQQDEYSRCEKIIPAQYFFLMYILVANFLSHFERDGVLPSNLINIEKTI